MVEEVEAVVEDDGVCFMVHFLNRVSRVGCPDSNILLGVRKEN